MMRLLLVLLAAGVALAFKTWVQKALVAGIVASNIHVSPAHAFSLFPSAEQSTVNTIASFQKPVNELYDNLRPSEVPNPIGVYATQQILKGGKDLPNTYHTPQLLVLNFYHTTRFSYFVGSLPYFTIHRRRG